MAAAAALTPRKTIMEARPGTTDENPKAAAPVARRTIQYPCYFYGYTWFEVICDPPLLLVTSFILFYIWCLLTTWELNLENLPWILLFAVFYLPPVVFFCMLPFFAGYEDCGQTKKPSSSSGSDGKAARPPQKDPSVLSTTEVVVAVRQRQGGGSPPARVSVSVSID